MKGNFLKPVAHKLDTKSVKKIKRKKEVLERKTAACFCMKILNLTEWQKNKQCCCLEEKAADNISIISDSTGLVTLCVENAFDNRLLKDRPKGG